MFALIRYILLSLQINTQFGYCPVGFSLTAGYFYSTSLNSSINGFFITWRWKCCHDHSFLHCTIFCFASRHFRRIILLSRSFKSSMHLTFFSVSRWCHRFRSFCSHSSQLFLSVLSDTLVVSLHVIFVCFSITTTTKTMVNLCGIGMQLNPSKLVLS